MWARHPRKVTVDVRVESADKLPIEHAGQIVSICSEINKLTYESVNLMSLLG